MPSTDLMRQTVKVALMIDMLPPRIFHFLLGTPKGMVPCVCGAQLGSFVAMPLILPFEYNRMSLLLEDSVRQSQMRKGNTPTIIKLIGQLRSVSGVLFEMSVKAGERSKQGVATFHWTRYTDSLLFLRSGSFMFVP